MEEILELSWEEKTKSKNKFLKILKKENNFLKNFKELNMNIHKWKKRKREIILKIFIKMERF